MPDESLAGIRSSTEEYASLNARSVREVLGTTWGLRRRVRVGRQAIDMVMPRVTCVAVSGPVERTITLETGASGREANMWAFVDAAFGLLEECLEEAD